MLKNMNDEPLLTVILISYNHVNYVEKCIESVLSQNTNFNFKICIYDDASTDGTSDIIRSYAKKYPNKIFAYINEKNVGGTENVFNALKDIQTKYYATCETDDYWDDNLKLQKQVDILEKNTDCSFCGHNTWWFDCKQNKILRPMFSKKIKSKKIELSQKFKMKDLIKVHPSSRVYRTACLDLSTVKNKESVTWDSCSFWYFLSKGKLYYSDEIMSVYNYTYEGIYSGANNDKRKQMSVNNILTINKELDYKYNFVFLKLLKKVLKLPFFTYLKIKYFYDKEKLIKFYNERKNISK